MFRLILTQHIFQGSRNTTVVEQTSRFCGRWEHTDARVRRPPAFRRRLLFTDYGRAGDKKDLQYASLFLCCKESKAINKFEFIGEFGLSPNVASPCRGSWIFAKQKDWWGRSLPHPPPYGGPPSPERGRNERGLSISPPNSHLKRKKRTGAVRFLWLLITFAGFVVLVW